MMKVIFEREAADEAILDHDFIAGHTEGFAALKADIETQDWADMVAVSGISEDQIRRCADIYIRSKATIICYGMGITQHELGSRLVQQIANILLLKGNFGRPGAGISPIRGHSNVQGDRTVGIDEKPTPALSRPRPRCLWLRPAARAWPSYGRIGRGDGTGDGARLHRARRAISCARSPTPIAPIGRCESSI
jgi:anaerobic selenocysteine-containing dehydrogenase